MSFVPSLQITRFPDPKPSPPASASRKRKHHALPLPRVQMRPPDNNETQRSALPPPLPSFASSKSELLHAQTEHQLLPMDNMQSNNRMSLNNGQSIQTHARETLEYGTGVKTVMRHDYIRNYIEPRVNQLVDPQRQRRINPELHIELAPFHYLAQLPVHDLSEVPQPDEQEALIQAHGSIQANDEDELEYSTDRTAIPLLRERNAIALRFNKHYTTNLDNLLENTVMQKKQASQQTSTASVWGNATHQKKMLQYVQSTSRSEEDREKEDDEKGGNGGGGGGTAPPPPPPPPPPPFLHSKTYINVLTR